MTRCRRSATQTPREAAKNRQGRERLQALLADFAWRAKETPPEQRPDLARLRESLGLDRSLDE